MTKLQKKERTKRRNTQGEKTRLTILKVAGRLFAQKGYDGVSIRCISDEMGTMPSLIMHHFGNKVALYRKTIEHFVVEGEYFFQATEPLSQVNVANKQASANALAETVHRIFEVWHGPRRVKYLNSLVLQIISSSGPISVQQTLAWVAPTENVFKTFFKRIRPDLSSMEINVRMEVFWGHVFYPATIRNFLLTEHSWKDYPLEWLLAWKKTIASDFCRGLNLPDPTFVYPEEEQLPESDTVLYATKLSQANDTTDAADTDPLSPLSSRLPLPVSVNN